MITDLVTWNMWVTIRHVSSSNGFCTVITHLRHYIPLVEDIHQPTNKKQSTSQRRHVSEVFTLRDTWVCALKNHVILLVKSTNEDPSRGHLGNDCITPAKTLNTTNILKRHGQL